MNQNFTLPAFTEPITTLPDTPQCPASELKRRLQAPAEELRQVHNALAEEHAALDEKVEGIVAETYGGTIHESMLDTPLAEKLNAKADDSANEAAHAAFTTQIAAKCEAVFGTYTGDGAASQTITLGFQPKAVYTTNSAGRDGMGNINYGGLAFPGLPSTSCTITETGFTVTSGGGNSNGHTYKYIAVK